MLYTLEITNQHIYINDVPIQTFIRYWYHSQNDMNIYTISNVLFGSITGVLTVYENNHCINKLVFTSYNAVKVYNISNVEQTYDSVIQALKNDLKSRYRSIDDCTYFNKRFEFRLTYSDNNFSLLVTRR